MSSPDPGGIQHFEESFGTLAELERTYAEGAYEFRVWTAPLKSCRVPIELSGRSFPPPPRIANLDAAQSFAAESDFTVQWDPWADGSAADFVQFTVKDNSGAVVFETPFLTQPETLNGLATSALIPAGTLSPAKPYVGELLWLRSVRESTGECAEVTAQAAYYCATEFPLATSAPPPTFRPSLRRSLPSNGGSGVPVRSVVAFEFSQPMAPEVAIAWSANAQTLDWTYQWDDSLTTLYAIANPPLPPTATVRWTLNASTEGPGFHGLNGMRLLMTQGSFVTTTPTAATTDIREVLLARNEDYTQPGDTPEPLGYAFASVQAELNGWNTVIRGSLELPNGRGLNSRGWGVRWETLAEYAFKADLERFLPSGEYVLTLETARDGVRSFSLPSSGAAIPAPPRLLATDTLRSINSNEPYSLTWAPFTEGTADDFILLEIETDQGRKVLETGTDELPRLPGTATTFEIPAATFYPGRQYFAILRFLKILAADSTTYPGVEVLSLAATSTRFQLRTAGQPMPPVITVLPAPAGAFGVRVTGEPGRSYVIEVADILNWNNPGFYFNYWYRGIAHGGVFELIEYDLPLFPSHRFYRVRDDSP